MIDSIGSSTNLPAVSRSQSLSTTSATRSVDVLNAVQQSSQRSSGARAPVKVFAVPQSAKTGSGSNAKLPRGSLYDRLI
jgi:hypothetical protein